MKNKKDFIQIDNLNKQAFEAVFSEPDLGLKLCREAFKKSSSIDYFEGMTESKFQEGWCLLIKTNYEDSLKALEESLEGFKKLNIVVGEMKALNAFGVLYTNISNYETAMDYYIKSLELSKKTHNLERMGTAYINIGSLYAELKKNEIALDYYKKALTIIEKTNNQAQLCACQINIGDIYLTQKKFNLALNNYNEALTIAKCIKNRVYESNSLTSMGKLYQETRDFTKAEKHHRLSLEISELLGDNLGIAECLTNLADLYFIEKNNEKSIKYHKKALTISKSINSKYFSSKNYLGLSDAYNIKKDFKNALNYYKHYNNITIELQNEKIDLQLKNINVQKKIEKAKKDADIQRTKNKELQEALDRVSILNKIGQDITSSLDLETVMTTIYKNISTFISADIFGIALYDNKREEIDFKYFIVDGERIKGENKGVHTEGSMAGWVIINNEYLFINDLQNEYINYVTKLIGSNSGNTKSAIFVPLRIGTNIMGIITVQSNSLNAYTQQDLEIIQAVGAYSAIALENSKVHEEINKLNKIISSEKKILEKAYDKIDRLANHDILTGLPNRRLFIELLKQELRQTDRKKTKIAVLFIDLDDFKPVNDNLGHDAGDKVLQMVSQRFISTLRESDAIARIGGDEFAALICNVKNKNDIQKIAEKIIDKFKNPFKVDNSKFQIGISMGISIYPDDDDTMDELLKKADMAMYQVKSENKNAFIFYNDKN